MNRKTLTLILISILLVNLFFRLPLITVYSTRLLSLLSDYILNGNLFGAHILSHTSSFFWFNLIESLIPHVVVVSTIIGIIKYFRSDRTVINKYLVLGIILVFFPTFPELLILFSGMSKYSLEEYFNYDSVWSLIAQVMYFVGFIYVVVYFCIFRAPAQGNVNVNGDLKIRFKNYLIDTSYLAYLALRLFQFIIVAEEIYLLLIYVFTSILYYLYSEFLFSQSIGKLVTNTFVEFKGNKFAGSIIRSLTRRIPFEPFSFFLKGSSGRWHDKLSNSQLVTI